MQFKNSTFVRWLVSSLVILIVPILIGLFLMDNARNLVIDEYNAVNTALQKELDRSISSYLSEVKNFRSQLSSNAQLNQFIRQPPPLTLSQRNQIKDISDMLKSYRSFDSINSCYVYLNNVDLLISTSTVIPSDLVKSDIYKNEVIHYLDFNDYVNDFHAEEIVMIEIPELGKVYPVMVTSLPMEAFSGSMASIFQILNIDSLSQIMKNMTMDSYTEMMLLDKNGRIIAGNKNNEALYFSEMELLSGNSRYIECTIDGKESILMYNIVAAQPHWTQVTIIPIEAVKQKIKPIQLNSIIFTAVSLVLGVLLVTFITVRNYKPVRKLIEKISPSEDDSIIDPFQKIEQTILRVSTSNEQWALQWREQERFFQENFLNSVLHGGVMDTPVIRKIMKGFSLDIEGNILCIVMLFAVEFASSGISREIVEEMMSRLRDSSCVSFCAEIDEMVTLIIDVRENESATGEENYQKLCKRVAEEEKNSSFLMAISAPCSSLTSVRECYENTAQYMLYKQNQYFTTGEKNSDVRCPAQRWPNIFGIPVHRERQLVDSIGEGDFEKALYIYKKIFQDEKYGDWASSRYRCFASAMVNIIWKVTLQIINPKPCFSEKMEQMTNEYLSEPSPGKALLLMENLLRMVCDEFKMEVGSQDPLLDMIIECINQNYEDNNFNVSRMSEIMEKNLSYLSKYFKSNTGVGLSDYINRMRINKGKRLLLEEKMSISKVAQAVGFDNPNSFIRAFKKIENMTPGLYRSGSLVSGSKMEQE